MAGRNYWLDLFSVKTWDEFLKAGASVSGFRESRWNAVEHMRPGDALLAYLTGVSRFIGALEVVGAPFRDESRIWGEDVFPARVNVRVCTALSVETAVPVVDILDRFSWSKDLQSPIAWTGHFRGSPTRWLPADGEMVLRAIEDAQRDPIRRPVDPKKLARRLKVAKTPIGPVVVPEAEPLEARLERIETPAEVSEHTAIQWLLLKLGSDMGLDVWAARNDRGREFRGRRFDDLRGFRRELPRQFDPVTSRTIELIDVLWLDKNSIEAAFEIESTTSIYSGLLRMADLLALQPNLKIPLFLVAPDERREKVASEINRPVFRKMEPPLATVCHYLAFSALRSGIREIGSHVNRVVPAIVHDWAEPVDIEEE